MDPATTGMRSEVACSSPAGIAVIECPFGTVGGSGRTDRAVRPPGPASVVRLPRRPGTTFSRLTDAVAGR